MTDLMKKALERVGNWPADRQAEAAELLLALDDLGGEPIEVDADDLEAIDEALAQIARGETADSRKVEDLFARFRK